jgi:hypothetical protein
MEHQCGGKDGDQASSGVHLGVGGTATTPGKRIVFPGGAFSQVYAGRTVIPVRSWNHVVLVTEANRVAVYLNFANEPETLVSGPPRWPPGAPQLFLAGDSSGSLASFEGKIDEVAIDDRARAR